MYALSKNKKKYQNISTGNFVFLQLLCTLNVHVFIMHGSIFFFFFFFFFFLSSYIFFCPVTCSSARIDAFECDKRLIYVLEFCFDKSVMCAHLGLHHILITFSRKQIRTTRRKEKRFSHK